MIQMLETGSQLIVATHSPLLAALPGADLLQLTADGMHPVATYDDTDLVTSWRAFLGPLWPPSAAGADETRPRPCADRRMGRARRGRAVVQTRRGNDFRHGAPVA